MDIKRKKSYPKIQFLWIIRTPSANSQTIFKSSVFLPLRTWNANLIENFTHDFLISLQGCEPEHSSNYNQLLWVDRSYTFLQNGSLFQKKPWDGGIGNFDFDKTWTARSKAENDCHYQKSPLLCCSTIKPAVEDVVEDIVENTIDCHQGRHIA